MALSGWLCYLIPKLQMALMFYPKLSFFAGIYGKLETIIFLKILCRTQLEPFLWLGIGLDYWKINSCLLRSPMG
ncbi:hypothetical protein GBA52_016590 [Prunus armeniaca]|nr:hypothetical protein GBA52_016590 [Prunus armeniaca]